MCYARRQRLSWARIKLSKNCITCFPIGKLITFFQSYLLAFLNTAFWVYISCAYISFFRINEFIVLSTYFLSFVLSRCCSIFKDRSRFPFFGDSFVIIALCFRFVKYFFHFFQVFSKKSKSIKLSSLRIVEHFAVPFAPAPTFSVATRFFAVPTPLFWGDLCIISLYFRFVKPFFEKS